MGSVLSARPVRLSEGQGHFLGLVERGALAWQVQGGDRGRGCSYRVPGLCFVLDPPEQVSCKGAPFPPAPRDPHARGA